MAQSATVQSERLQWTGAMPTQLGPASRGATPLQLCLQIVQVA